jgi:molybdate transport system ATP-binding protein
MVLAPAAQRRACCLTADATVKGSMKQPTIRIENVRLPLAHFDLQLDVTIHGQVTAVLGPSGAGKTSLLDLLAGLRRTRQGRLRVGERVLSDGVSGLFVPPEHRRIGYVPQDGALFPHLSVRNNLLYGQRRNEASAKFSLDGILEVLEIHSLLARPDVSKLSGGERQRVALARALLSGPELLLLDEPLASLDAELKERILPYLRRVRDEFRVPMLLVTHSPSEVMALCDEALVLERGQVIQQGHPAELFVKSSEPLWVRREVG